jgi:hypothetical protein
MPICPGCECSVPYERLDNHERYCKGVWGEASLATSAIEQIERRLQLIEGKIADRSESGWEQLDADESSSQNKKEKRK